MGRIDLYWNSRLGLDDELERPGVHVVPHAKYPGDDLAYVFVRGDSAVIAVARSALQNTRERVRHVDPGTLLAPSHISAVIDGPISHCVGPMYEGYAEADDFRPAPSAGTLTLGPAHIRGVRAFTEACEDSGSEITPIWREALQRFMSGSDTADVVQSGVARAESPLFAAVDDSGILAVAHYSMWAVDAASIGVLTHPAHRGRGWGKVSVSAAIRHALAGGHFILYRTLLANRASVALAASLGCRDYGRFLAVHLH